MQCWIRSITLHEVHTQRPFVSVTTSSLANLNLQHPPDILTYHHSISITQFSPEILLEINNAMKRTRIPVPASQADSKPPDDHGKQFVWPLRHPRVFCHTHHTSSTPVMMAYYASPTCPLLSPLLLLLVVARASGHDNPILDWFTRDGTTREWQWWWTDPIRWPTTTDEVSWIIAPTAEYPRISWKPYKLHTPFITFGFCLVQMTL